MKFYLVGGILRDRMLGKESKDYDYSVVLDNIENKTVEEGFEEMKQNLIEQGFRIFLSTPTMYTIRAKFPKGHKHEELTADFVLARKEVGYIEGTRRPILELGTLEDDLIRRDFTVNAMAEDEDGNLIDLFGGQEDLKKGILRTPQDPNITLLDDPLRLLRAFRFSVTKEMNIGVDIIKAAKHNPQILNKLNKVVSQERIREELNKMFKHDTIYSLILLETFNRTFNYNLFPILFKDGYRLEMTNKLK